MYNPDEPRDNSGKWTSLGSTPGYIKDKILANNPEAVLQEKIDKALADGKDSLTMYQFDGNGDLTAERKDLHERILNGWLNQGSTRTGVVYSMGGAPANGKSTIVDAGVLNFPQGVLKLDVDKFKVQLPEYQLMKEKGDPRAAAFTHEESSYLGKEAKRRALQRGYDLVIDGVGDNGISDVEDRVADYKAAGKRAVADYVTLDTDLSVKIAKERGIKTGRFVPETYVREKNKDIATLVPQLVQGKVFDELRVWDANENGKARLIISQVDGKTTIHDQDLYKRFLNKANGK